MFIGHKIENDNTLTLFIDPHLHEFSSELGVQDNGKKQHLNESIRVYLKERIPNLHPNVVKVVMGSIVIATVSLVGGQAPSAQAESNNVSTQSQKTHTVSSGDTLYGIAKQYNVSVSQIKQLNHLTGDMIYPGQTLVISNVTPAPTTTSYTVKAGETLYSIANTYKMSVDQLKQLNNLTSNTIHVGQSLRVTSADVQSPTQIQGPSYTVQPGDSLYSIAQRSNTSVDQLMKNNNLTSSQIFVGQTLQISGTAGNTPSQQAPDSTYTVKSGDTLYGIARKYNMSATELQRLNNITSTTLSIGQVLKVNGEAQSESGVSNREQVLAALVKDSYNFIGVPYRWGGTTTAGFDCSGFVSFMHARHGIDIPRTTSADYYRMGTAVSKANLQPGDLVFYAVDDPNRISHVGFYVGNNEFISATSSKGIAVVSMDNSYWSKYYVGAKRVY